MKNRRYIIGFDNKMVSGYEMRWPKARAIERADQIVESMGGAAIVGRTEHGSFRVVHESVADPVSEESEERGQ